MNSKWLLEKEKLEQLILIDKLSYEEIGKKYNCSGSNIKKVASKIGITLPKRRKLNPNETFNKGVHKVIVSNINIPKPIQKVGTKTYCLNCGHELDGYAKKYCSSKCQIEYKHKLAYKKFLEGDLSIMRANYNPRVFKKDIIKEQNNKCAICGLEPEWNNKELVFILDHIDGHAANNKRDNLRCICPNCDSQLDTYKSKNKNGDRHYYRYHKNK